MRVWHLVVGAIVLLVLGIGWFFISDGKGNLMFQGALMTDAPAAAVSVPAAGTNLRAYSFIDAFGRFCTGTYSNEGGSWGDCEFPPGWEANETVIRAWAEAAEETR